MKERVYDKTIVKDEILETILENNAKEKKTSKIKKIEKHHDYK